MAEAFRLRMELEDLAEGRRCREPPPANRDHPPWRGRGRPARRRGRRVRRAAPAGVQSGRHRRDTDPAAGRTGQASCPPRSLTWRRCEASSRVRHWLPWRATRTRPHHGCSSPATHSPRRTRRRPPARRPASALSVRAADQALDQTAQLLAAIRTVGTDLRAAKDAVAPLLAEVVSELDSARGAGEGTAGKTARPSDPAVSAQLAAAVSTGEQAVAAARAAIAASTMDPLAELRRLRDADTALDQATRGPSRRAGAGAPGRRDARPRRILAARAEISAATDFLNTRRGAVGGAGPHPARRGAAAPGPGRGAGRRRPGDRPRRGAASRPDRRAGQPGRSVRCGRLGRLQSAGRIRGWPVVWHGRSGRCDPRRHPHRWWPRRLGRRRLGAVGTEAAASEVDGAVVGAASPRRPRLQPARRAAVQAGSSRRGGGGRFYAEGGDAGPAEEGCVRRRCRRVRARPGRPCSPRGTRPSRRKQIRLRRRQVAVPGQSAVRLERVDLAEAGRRSPYHRDRDGPVERDHR